MLLVYYSLTRVGIRIDTGWGNAGCSTSVTTTCSIYRLVEMGVRGVSYTGPRDVWGPAVAHKYEVHQNAPL